MTDTPTSCDGCGLCCEGQNLLPWTWAHLDHAYKASLPVKLADELRTIAEGPLAAAIRKEEECCVWLDRATGRCKNYEHRPEPCRQTVKLGDASCMRYREQSGYDFLTRQWKSPSVMCGSGETST